MNQIYNIKSINELPFHIETPSFQRPINEKTVNNIFIALSTQMRNTGETYPIEIKVCRVCILGVEHYFLIDGQHRIAAIDRISKSLGLGISFYVIVYNAKSEDDMRKYYIVVNTPNTPSDIHLHGTATHFDNEMEVYLSKLPCFTAKANKRPYVNITFFMNEFGKSKYKYSINSIEQFELFLIDFNNKAKNHYSDFNNRQRENITDNMFIIASKNKMYIGLDRHLSYLFL